MAEPLDVLIPAAPPADWTHSPRDGKPRFRGATEPAGPRYKPGCRTASDDFTHSVEYPGQPCCRWNYLYMQYLVQDPDGHWHVNSCRTVLVGQET